MRSAMGRSESPTAVGLANPTVSATAAGPRPLYSNRELRFLSPGLEQRRHFWLLGNGRLSDWTGRGFGCRTANADARIDVASIGQGQGGDCSRRVQKIPGDGNKGQGGSPSGGEYVESGGPGSGGGDIADEPRHGEAYRTSSGAGDNSADIKKDRAEAGGRVWGRAFGMIAARMWR